MLRTKAIEIFQGVSDNDDNEMKTNGIEKGHNQASDPLLFIPNCCSHISVAIFCVIIVNYHNDRYRDVGF